MYITRITGTLFFRVTTQLHLPGPTHSKASTGTTVETQKNRFKTKTRKVLLNVNLTQT